MIFWKPTEGSENKSIERAFLDQRQDPGLIDRRLGLE